MEIATMNKISFMKESVKFDLHTKINARAWLFKNVVYGYRTQALHDKEFINDYLYQFDPTFVENSRETWEERKNSRIEYLNRRFQRGKISETLLRIVINSKRHSNN